MAKEGCPYSGVLFAGIMVTESGPKLLEYNVRFGDPECQVLMTRMMSDPLPALIASADGVLDTFDLRWYDEVALTVVMASQGYPGDYEKGSEIKGIDAAMASDETVMVFHAGTSLDPTGKLLATGGRVLNVTARGATVKEAQARAYAAIAHIDWRCRRDIGWRAGTRRVLTANSLLPERLVSRGAKGLQLAIAASYHLQTAPWQRHLRHVYRQYPLIQCQTVDS